MPEQTICHMRRPRKWLTVLKSWLATFGRGIQICRCLCLLFFRVMLVFFQTPRMILSCWIGVTNVPLTWMMPCVWWRTLYLLSIRASGRTVSLQIVLCCLETAFIWKLMAWVKWNMTSRLLFGLDSNLWQDLRHGYFDLLCQLLKFLYGAFAKCLNA